MAEVKKAFKRLPKSIKPVLYDLYLKPDLQKFTFEGEETVSIHVSTTYIKVLIIFTIIMVIVLLWITTVSLFLTST